MGRIVFELNSSTYSLPYSAKYSAKTNNALPVQGNTLGGMGQPFGKLDRPFPVTRKKEPSLMKPEQEELFKKKKGRTVARPFLY